MRSWPSRLGISTVAAAALLSSGYYLWAILLPAARAGDAAWPTTGIVYDALTIAGATVAAVLALVVIWGAPVSAASAIFSLDLAALALATADGGSFRLLDAALASAGASAVVQSRASALLLAAALACSLSAGFRWTQLFPRRLTASDIAAHVRNGAVRRLQSALLNEPVGWLGLAAVVLAVFCGSALALDRWPVAQMAIVLSVATGLMAVATLNLWVNHQAGTRDERTRIYWVLEAGIVATILIAVALCVEIAYHGLGFTHGLIDWIHAGVLPLATLLVVSLMGVAALYGGAVDSRLVIRKTVLYGATGVLLTAVFVAVEGVASEFVVGRLGLPERAGGWLAGLAVALTFGPLKERLDRRIRHRYGSAAAD